MTTEKQTYPAALILDLYCRVSTDFQEDNTSLDEQEASGRAFIEKLKRETGRNIIVGMVHKEVASGYMYREREKLSITRERYQSGKIQGVVIRTLDRLSRSQTHVAILLEEMEHYNVTLYSTKEKIDDTVMGKFARIVLAFVAEMEREKILDRTSTGRINKAKDGKIVSGYKAPYGWKWHMNEKNEKDAIEINEEEADILRWLAKEYNDGVSAYRLADVLDKRGVPVPSQKEGLLWNPSVIVRMLTNPRITGKNAQMFFSAPRKETKHQLGAIDLPDGTYPAILNEELYQGILKRTERNKLESNRNSKYPEEYLLRAGFIKCGACGRNMGANVGNDSTKSKIYLCAGKKGKCRGNIAPTKELDRQVWEKLQHVADHIDLIEKAIELATNSDSIDKDTRAIDNALASWKITAENYMEDLQDNSLRGDTRKNIRRLLNDANQMIENLEKEKAELALGMIDREKEKQEYQKLLLKCKEIKEGKERKKPFSYQEKRDLLRLLGVMVYAHKRNSVMEERTFHIEVSLPEIGQLIKQPNIVTSTSKILL